MRKIGICGVSIAALLIGSFGVATAATTTNQFNVKLNIVSGCDITNSGANDLDFGTHSVLVNDLEEQTDIKIACTTGQSYEMVLDKGVNGASVNDRKMVSGANNVSYNLYKDSAHTQLWGDVAGQGVTGTGTGSEETKTIYGLVPATGTAPAVGNYLDTVTISFIY